MPRRAVRAVALIVSCLGAVALASASTSAQTADPPTRLEPGRSVERPLAGKATHRYALTLQQNERAEVSALQRGLDVVIRVAAPDGKVLGEFDDEARDGREEHAEVVAVAVASVLNNLANVYRSTGDVPRALETLFQAVSIFEKYSGPYNLVTPLGNIARNYLATNDLPHAIEYQRRVDAAVERLFVLGLAIGSERQKPVSDYVTCELMTDYVGLEKGLGRGDALRQAKLTMLERTSGRQHPFYWASFIQAGEWAPLDGRR